MSKTLWDFRAAIVAMGLLGCGGVEAPAHDAMPIPDAPPSPPVIASVTPERALVHGGESFTLTGTGFTDASTVRFGNNVTIFNVVSDTEITGTVPQASALDAAIEVTTAAGSGELAHRYGGIYLGTGAGGTAGGLYLIDPRDAFALSLGAFVDADSVTSGITGLTMSADGTLYGATTARGFRDGGTGELQTIALDGTVTVIGPLVDAASVRKNIASLAFVGPNLFGWAEGVGVDDDLVTIDPATGQVTIVADSGLNTFGSGLATLDGTAMLLAPARSNGALYSVATDGTVTAGPTLLGVPARNISGLTGFRGELYGVLNNNGDGQLALLDSVTGAVAIIGDLPPAAEDLASDDPLAMGRAPLVHMTIAASTMVARVAGCEDGATRTLTTGSRSIVVDSIGTMAGSKLVAHKNGSRAAVTVAALVSAGARVTSCDGTTTMVAPSKAATVGVMANQRSQFKLVDLATGEKLASDIIRIDAQ